MFLADALAFMSRMFDIMNTVQPHIPSYDVLS
jgi:hypothetical protein